MYETYDDIINDIRQTAEILWHKGWAERNAGNISVRLNKKILNAKNEKNYTQLPKKYKMLANDYILITASGVKMRDLAKNPENGIINIKIDNKGQGYYYVGNIENKNLQPTSELLTHLEVHSLLKDKNMPYTTILHTHPTEIIALTHIQKYCNTENLNNLIWNMHPETNIFLSEGVGFVPYKTPGSAELAEETVNAIEKHRIAVWEKHGVLAVGHSISDTFDNIDILAKSAKIFLMIP